ncbi:MAG: glycosyltransferase family 1 protein [Variovorax sp.]|nr:MAG: glycosyltransferase family 1 protein [Variovorax sp.]
MSNPHADPRSPTPLPGLVINGKFLQASTSRSGVYRVAREMLVALDRLLAENDALAAALRCRVLVPGDPDAGLRLSRIRVESDPVRPGRSPALRRLGGVLWEQTTLPRRARGETLVSLCNIGPVLHRDAFTMVHDAQVYTSPQSYSRTFRAWYRFALPLLGRHNRALLTVSRHSREQLDRFGVAAAARIHVIPNGCDHVLRLAPDPRAVADAGLAGRPYVVALANRQRHKNIPVLLEAFHAPALRHVTLALFGPARHEDFERQGVRVPPNARFLGFVGDEQLAGLLRHALALAFPSTTEGFGLPPLEAMALGCPTIVAPCGALPEVCGDAALWADPHAPAAWVDGIVRLRDDPGLRADLRRRGLAQAARFTWREAACGLLEAVLGRSRAELGLSPRGDAPHRLPSSPSAARPIAFP